MEDDPAPGERDGDAVVGPRHPARCEARHQPGQVAGVDRQRLREGRARRRRKRLDLPRLVHVAVCAQCIERVGQRFLDLAGVHQLAQQGVHQPGEDEPVGQAGSMAIPPAIAVTVELVVRAQQLARPEEEGRCVLAPRRDDVVGGVLQPGPQTRRPGRDRNGGGPPRRRAGGPGPRPRCHDPARHLSGAGAGVRREPSLQCVYGV